MFKSLKNRIKYLCNSKSEKIKEINEANLLDSSKNILAALGGEGNIENVDACLTRLRVSVKNISKVDMKKIKKLGATSVLKVEGKVQAVFGAMAEPIREKLVEIIKK